MTGGGATCLRMLILIGGDSFTWGDRAETECGIMKRVELSSCHWWISYQWVTIGLSVSAIDRLVTPSIIGLMKSHSHCCLLKNNYSQHVLGCAALVASLKKNLIKASLASFVRIISPSTIFPHFCALHPKMAINYNSNNHNYDCSD